MVDFGYEDVAYDVAVHPYGRISVVGSAEDAQGEARLAVATLTRGGGPDDLAGWSLSPAGDDYVYGLDIVDDGGIVLGVNLFSGDFDPHVVKLTPSGAFDTSFGGRDGWASNVADGYQMVDIDIRSDGRILGVVRGDQIASFLLSRRGVPAEGYGMSGLAFTSTPMIAAAMYVDAQDRPVITGLQLGEPHVIRLQS